MHSVSPLYAAAELKAHEHRSNHAFAKAADSAREAADIAHRDGDNTSSWNMTFLQAENLLDADRFEDCAGLAKYLLSDAPGFRQAHDLARAHVLLARANQGVGLLEFAAEEARAAVVLTDDEAHIDINVKARQALIAALADAGQMDEAWRESKILASVISDEVDEQQAGKGYWVIGNVAFLSEKVSEGLRYHELAAATFSPARDLDIWAKFNKASAAMRLAANVADEDTLRCIERAELATDIIGGSENDLLLLRLIRGHWTLLAGDPQTAAEMLQELCRSGGMTPQNTGDSCFLLGRALLETGEKSAARCALEKAAAHFENAGAKLRAEQAREFIAVELGPVSLWSRLWRAAGFGRH
ncbi:hypothetical protein [Arthrobacter sp. BPSS-3]|uniref:hypothetical protein n=1 Tax=Arthrobacter sp. BPSS-3 TaxID=3366580 RepID=UPI0037DD49F1